MYSFTSTRQMEILTHFLVRHELFGEMDGVGNSSEMIIVN